MDRREMISDDVEARLVEMESHQVDMWTALPGIIDAVDLERQTVSVTPAIKGVQPNPDGVFEPVKMPLLVDVPLCFPRAGGFALTFPVAIGDECLVVFSSRCIDEWWAAGGIQEAAELRMHDLSDGFAILAPTSQPKKLADVSSSNVQLRNESGDTFLEIDPNGMVRILTPGQCIVDASEMYFTASSSMKFAAPTIWMAGNIMTTGSAGGSSGGTLKFNGDIQHTGTLTVNGKDVSDQHTHTNVQPGTGTSGPVA